MNRHAEHWVWAASETTRELRDSFARRGLARNVAAGISTALVALPLNIALALACDLPASVGLWTGALAGIVGAVLGGARLQITGPEVALAPMSYAIVSEHGLDGLLWCTLLAGLLQVVFGAARLGRYVRAIPAPVILGFMIAVGLMVLDGQLPRLLGMPDETRSLFDAITLGRATLDPTPTLLGLAGCALVVGLPRLHPRIPAPLVAVAVVMFLVWALALRVPHVPDVDSVHPAFGLRALSTGELVALLPSALGLALLASLDSLLSAVSLDARMGTRHRSDQELVAQGVANALAGLCGGMPVAGAIVRSAAAADAGGDNRAAPLVQSLVLGTLLLAMGHHLDAIPLTVLAGILCVVGAKLVQPDRLLALFRRSRVDAVIALVTTVSILAIDFVAGVAVGVAVSLGRFALGQARLRVAVDRSRADARVAVVRVDGPLVFATVAGLEETLLGIEHPRLELDLAGVCSVDVTAVDGVRRAFAQLSERGVEVEVVNARPAVARQVSPRGGVEPATETDASARARELARG
ncbi:MAG: SulP family inorganic anion transporter [Myxococcota bacterium]|nr:SulP family inorganic anion transporter [Myxococcota bacterium]